jgi:hypothetical protein
MLRKNWSRVYLPGLYLLLFLLWLIQLCVQLLLYFLITNHKIDASFPLGRSRWGALVEAVLVLVAIALIPCGCGDQRGVAWNDTKSIEMMFAAWQTESQGCPSAGELVQIMGRKMASQDPWGNEYRIQCPSAHDLDVDVCSDGPDQTPNTQDDICNFNPNRP